MSILDISGEKKKEYNSIQSHPSSIVARILVMERRNGIKLQAMNAIPLAHSHGGGPSPLPKSLLLWL